MNQLAMDQMILKEDCLVTFVIACRDRGELLGTTIKAIQQQTCKNWQLLVVDDYSQEDLDSVISQFADKRIRLVKNQNVAGISGARNYGNSLVQTPLVAVSDSDDINLPRRLEVSLRYFEEHPETDLFYSNIYCFNHGSDVIWPYQYFHAYDRDLLYERDFIPHGTVVYRTDVINQLKYDESINAAVDYEMLLRFADQKKNFGFVEEPLLLYRRHPEQISTDSERRKIQQQNTLIIKEKHAQYR